MPPAINPLYPLDRLDSVDALMGIAVAMEREAAERYTQLADAMAARGEADMAATFSDLARLEREHEHGLGRWAAREGGKPIPADVAWRLPETFGDEGARRDLSPYAALGIAVRNEERAFAFYTYLAAMAPRPDIRRRAEALAREELNHVHQLRVLRRRAFHAGRRQAPLAPMPRDRAHLQALAAEIEGAAGTASRAEALRHAEAVAEYYLEVAEAARDEALLREAQALAERAVSRLALARVEAEMEEQERRRP